MKDTKQRVKFIALIALVMAAVIVLSVCVSLFGRAARTSSDANAYNAQGGLKIEPSSSCRQLKLAAARSGDSSVTTDEPVTLTAAYSPANAPKPTLVWSAEFVGNTSWGDNKNVSDYVTLTVAANTLSATVAFAQAFGDQIVIKAAVENRSNVFATCTVDYVKPLLFQSRAVTTIGANYGEKVSPVTTNTPTYNPWQYFTYGRGTGSINYIETEDLAPAHTQENWQWSWKFGGTKSMYQGFMSAYINFAKTYDSSISTYLTTNYLNEILGYDVSDFSLNIKINPELKYSVSYLYTPGYFLAANALGTSQYSLHYKIAKTLDAFMAQNSSSTKSYNVWYLTYKTYDVLGRLVTPAKGKTIRLDYTVLNENNAF